MLTLPLVLQLCHHQSIKENSAPKIEKVAGGHHMALLPKQSIELLNMTQEAKNEWPCIGPSDGSF